MTLHFAGYKMEEIHSMDDSSVFLRFFIATNMLSEVLGTFGMSASPLPTPSYVPEYSPTVGENPLAASLSPQNIPPVKPKKRRKAPSSTSNRYKFPQ